MNHEPDICHLEKTRPAFLGVVVIVTLLFLTASLPAEVVDAVILEHHLSYEVKNGKEARLIEQRRIEIRNADGRHHGSIHLLESEFIKLSSFNGTVYDVNGNQVYSCSKDGGRERSGYGGYALYADHHEYGYELTSNKYPYVIDYSYTLELRSLFFWPDWYPQDVDSVRLATYTLIAPADFAFHTRATGEIADHTVSEQGKQVAYEWRLENLAPIEPEGCGPPLTQMGLSLRFAPWLYEFGGERIDGSNWITLSRTFATLTKNCGRLDSDQERLVSDWMAASAPPGIVASVDQYLKERARYVAIEIGIGGWVPSEAKETLKRGYGDCKDLATAFTALLGYAGINSHPALALTKTHGEVDPELPALSSFNHVILFADVDGDTLWHDPTCGVCLPGDLPWWDEGINVLVVAQEGGPLLTTPLSSASDNLIVRTARLSDLDQNSPAIELRLTASGNALHRLLYLRDHVSRSDLPAALEEAPFNLGEQLQVDDLELEDTTIILRGHLRRAIRNFGGQTHLDLGFLPLLAGCETADVEERSEVLQFTYPLTYVDSVIFLLPPSWRLAAPIDTAVNSESFGTLHCSAQVDGEQFLLVRERAQARYQVDPTEFADFAGYREDLLAAAKRFLDFELE